MRTPAARPRAAIDLGLGLELPLPLPLPELAEKIATGLGRGFAAYLTDPECLSGLAGSVLLPLAIYNGRRPPSFAAYLIIALAGDQAGRMLFRAQRNLQALADAATANQPEDDRA